MSDELNNGVDLLTALGGGGGGIGSALLIYHNFIGSKLKDSFKADFDKVTTRKKEKKEKIKEDREAFSHFQEDYSRNQRMNAEAVKRVDDLESKLEDFSVEVSHNANSLKDRFNDFKSGNAMQDLRIGNIEEKERKQYEEITQMTSNGKLLEQRLDFMAHEISELKTGLSELTKSMLEMKDAILKLALKLDK